MSCIIPEMQFLKSLLLGSMIILSSHYAVEHNLESAKQIALHKLINLIVDQQFIENLRKDLLLKIQSGLALTNNAIFEELLQEIQGDKADLIRKYHVIEGKMNEQIVRSFNKQIDMAAIVKDINLKVYSEHYTRSEIEDLLRFYSSPLGRKFLRVSKSMVNQTQTLSTEALVNLSVKVTDEVQDFMQKQIAELMKEDLSKSWDED